MTSRPVLRTDSVTVSISQGNIVRRSISSQLMPASSAKSHAYQTLMTK